MTAQPPGPNQGPRQPAAQRSGMEIGSGRRRSDSSALAVPPQMQVVGFHVEGSTASPLTASLLMATGDMALSTGSPVPVIIPPSFQRDHSGVRNAQSADAANAAVASMLVDGALSRRSSAGTNSLNSSVLGVPGNTEGNTSGGGAAVDSPRRSTGVSRSSSRGSLLPTNSVDKQAGAAAAPAVPAAGVTMVAPAVRSPETAAASSNVVPSGVTGEARRSTSGAVASASTPAAAVVPSPATSAAAGDKPKATRAERRELQERQRAEKAAAKGGGEGGGSSINSNTVAAPERSKGSERGGDKGLHKAVAAVMAQSGASGSRTPSFASGDAKGHSRPLTSGTETPLAMPSLGPPPHSNKRKDKAMSLNSTELFAHLQQYKRLTATQLLTQRDVSSVHPAVLQLGLRYANGTIKGANARCMAMLNALCHMIRDYSTPEGKSLARDLTVHLNVAINFLVECRPLSFSMGNAIKHLKLRISAIDPAKPEGEAKAFLISEIAEFVNVRIAGADKLLISSAVHKVESGDVVLTYAYSSIVYEVLLAAHNLGRRFRVIVVDSRPELEGRYMLERLLQAGMPCSYAHINGLSYIVREATKVFLGAAAVLSNGFVISRIGSAAVAMMANAHGRPVMICCESYKFHERVQLDSITNNELGDPEALASVRERAGDGPLSGWQDSPRLGLLNLKYDAMPAEYVTMIITEFGMIPPTSVPVILREYRQEM